MLSSDYSLRAKEIGSTCPLSVSSNASRSPRPGSGLAAASAVDAPAQQSAPVYKDASRPVSERVADLLGRMTLEEKVAQLVTRWTTLKPLQDAEGNFVPAGAPALLGQGLGQLARPSEIGGTEAGPHVRSPRQHAEFTNAVQKWVIENTRLGIPVMFHEEALHGFVAPEATHFPVPLAPRRHLEPGAGRARDGGRREGGPRPRLPDRALAGRRPGA